MVEKKTIKAASLPPAPYAAFGRLLSARLNDLGMTNNAEVGRVIGDKNGEMVRRYKEGIAMPRPARLKRLAVLVGLSPAELQHPGATNGRVTPGLLDGALAELSVDEQQLVEAYRQLPDIARKALRARAVELQEAFARRSTKNPFGGREGTQ